MLNQATKITFAQYVKNHVKLLTNTFTITQHAQFQDHNNWIFKKKGMVYRCIKKNTRYDHKHKVYKFLSCFDKATVKKHFGFVLLMQKL